MAEDSQGRKRAPKRSAADKARELLDKAVRREARASDRLAKAQAAVTAAQAELAEAQRESTYARANPVLHPDGAEPAGPDGAADSEG
jgi:multidrug efflux pump subunit AcrA (membrane-fusion protein)